MALNVKFLKGSSAGYAAMAEKNADTFYYTTDDNNLYLGGIKLSNGADLAAAVTRIGKNETDIADLVAQLGSLTGEGDGSIAKMIADALGQLPTQVATLIGEDAGKSVRTIANEELVKQLIGENAKESLDTLQEIAAWIQSHPDDASAMAKAIDDLEALVGTLPEGVEATTIADYITEAVNAEQGRAEAAEKALDDRLKVVETAVGEGGSVDTQITNAINALDSDKKSADVEAGKGIQVQVAQIDGLITNVAVSGNFDETYDAKGAASAAQDAAATDATNKANAAETAAKGHADGLNSAMDARMKVVEAASTDAVKEVVSGTANGTIKVDNEDVAVTGLGSAAFAEAGAFDPEGAAATAEINAKNYVDSALTWGSF